MPAGMTSSSSVHSEGATVKERGALARLCRLLLPLRGACWVWAQGSIQPVPPRHQVSHRTKPCRADLLHCLAPEHARLCLLLERGTLQSVTGSHGTQWPTAPPARPGRALRTAGTSCFPGLLATPHGTSAPHIQPRAWQDSWADTGLHSRAPLSSPELCSTQPASATPNPVPDAST